MKMTEATETNRPSWYPAETAQAMKAAPKNQQWLADAAYFRFLERGRGGLDGTAAGDWAFAERKMDIMIEEHFLRERLRQSDDPNEKIALATIAFIATFQFLLPSEVVDDLRLGDLAFLEKGLGLGITCSAIGETAGVGELPQPVGAGTVGELIAALQASYAAKQRRTAKRK